MYIRKGTSLIIVGITVIFILIFFSRIYDVYFKDNLFIKRNVAIFKEQ